MEDFSKEQWKKRSSALRSKVHSVRESSERVKGELIVNGSRQDKIFQKSKVFVAGITNQVCVLKNSVAFSDWNNFLFQNVMPNLPAGSEWVTWCKAYSPPVLDTTDIYWFCATSQLQRKRNRTLWTFKFYPPVDVFVTFKFYPPVDVFVTHALMELMNAIIRSSSSDVYYIPCYCIIIIFISHFLTQLRCISKAAYQHSLYGNSRNIKNTASAQVDTRTATIP